MADDRAALLRRLRTGGQQAVRVRDSMASTTQKHYYTKAYRLISQESLNDLVSKACAASTPPGPTTPTAPTPAVPTTPVTLSPNEYESLMLQLEARFYSLQSDDWRIEADAVGAWERAEAESIAQAWLDTQQGPGPDAVWCPVCQANWVEESQGVLVCPCRHLVLDRRTEGLRLQHLRQRLEAVLQVAIPVGLLCCCGLGCCCVFCTLKANTDGGGF